jgi:hypothetical protein
MRYTSNERGALPVLVALLVVALVAVIGIAVVNANKARNKDRQSVSASPSPASSPASTASPAVDPYAGWQVYKSPSDGISFKYPADWKIVASYASQVDIAPTQGDTSFRVVFRALTNPSTQYDKSRCSYVRDIETVNIPSVGAKKMIAFGSNGMVGHLALTDNPYNIIGQEAGCSAVFASKAGVGKFVDLTAWYGSGSEGTKSFTFDQFTQKPEVQTAEKILRSATY